MRRGPVRERASRWPACAARRCTAGQKKVNPAALPLDAYLDEVMELLATEPTATFLLLCTVATITLIAAGIGASMLWFRSVLRRLGLRVRFAPA